MSQEQVHSLAEVFRRYAEELRRFLVARRGTPDAEDLVQEGFVRLMQGEAAALPENPRAWLYRTCSNLAADGHDHRRVRAAVHSEGARQADIEQVADAAADPARHVAARQQVRRVWAALQRLPEPCRHAFLLNRLDGMSQRAIAAHLGLSEKTVERHVLRCLETCRRALQDGD